MNLSPEVVSCWVSHVRRCAVHGCVAASQTPGEGEIVAGLGGDGGGGIQLSATAVRYRAVIVRYGQRDSQLPVMQLILAAGLSLSPFVSHCVSPLALC